MKILIMGGNRFFGKKLAKNLLNKGHEITLLNRGNIDDELGDQIQRLKCDRRNESALRKAVGNQKWDLIYDQVCFDAKEAEMASEIFKDKVEHYIFTSSQAVYMPGVHLKEDVFNSFKYKFKDIANGNTEYAEAKRQCEAVFFRRAALPITAVRFPIVVGSDDYTGRLKFHIEKIQAGAPIYFPNVQARISLISSADAAATLEFLGSQKAVGAINAASAEPISLENFIRTIESVLNKTTIFSDHEEGGNHSPYGISSDWFMDVSRLASLGFSPKPIQSWLTIEIKQLFNSVFRI